MLASEYVKNALCALHLSDGVSVQPHLMSLGLKALPNIIKQINEDVLLTPFERVTDLFVDSERPSFNPELAENVYRVLSVFNGIKEVEIKSVKDFYRTEEPCCYIEDRNQIVVKPEFIGSTLKVVYLEKLSFNADDEVEIPVEYEPLLHKWLCAELARTEAQYMKFKGEADAIYTAIKNNVSTFRLPTRDLG